MVPTKWVSGGISKSGYQLRFEYYPMGLDADDVPYFVVDPFTLWPQKQLFLLLD